MYDMGSADTVVFLKKNVELGAKVVGGCCGNTPEHIAAIVKAVKNTEEAEASDSSLFISLILFNGTGCISYANYDLPFPNPI